MPQASEPGGPTAAQRITDMIAGLPDWRGEAVDRLRRLVLEASPGINEEWKWGTPVWSDAGLVCSVGAFKEHVKLHVFKGASLEDPDGLFNAGLDAKGMRSIDLRQGEWVDEAALKALIRAAVDLNRVKGGRG